MHWYDVFENLERYARTHQCIPPCPPKPLVLGGWAYSNDLEKKKRWDQTVEWATHNGCVELIQIDDSQFYYVDHVACYQIGPLGGPMYLPWDFESKTRPDGSELSQHMKMLISQWAEIVGPNLASATSPLAFCGDKARRLLVRSDANVQPPWGSWSHLSKVESQRRTFTTFRAAINEAISPHEVDHIDFTTDMGTTLTK
jgi:hypothetical protein